MGQTQQSSVSVQCFLYIAGFALPSSAELERRGFVEAGSLIPDILYTEYYRPRVFLKFIGNK
jgi:hypothetical protein